MKKLHKMFFNRILTIFVFFTFMGAFTWVSGMYFNIFKPVKLLENQQRFNLTINSNPQGSEIWLNNEPIGESPITHKVNYGKNSLLIKNENYQTVEKELIIDRSNANEILID